MTDGGYDAFDDPYCYKGSFVLKNKAGHPLHLARVDRATLLPAMIASFHGQLEPLEQVIAGLRA